MERNKIEKLCEWVYHKGRVGMMEILKEVFTDDVFSKPICELINTIYEKEKEKLQELDNGV